MRKSYIQANVTFQRPDITCFKLFLYDFRGEDDDSKMGLIMVVLSLIFMSGNVLQDSKY